jgi:NADH:ubiquinone oxidoreductase subunit E
MAVARIELCVDNLDVERREALLDLLWEQLKISPGMTTASGAAELVLSSCGARPEDAPVVRVGDTVFTNVTPERLLGLVRRWSAR